MKHSNPRNLIFLALLSIPLLSMTLAVIPVAAQHSMPGMTMSLAFAKREREVMPFNLEATIHTFKNVSDGCTELVTVKNAKDSKNLALIRSHLTKEAKKFSQGDFSDPAYLHGKDMPGLAQVSAGAKAGKIKITYSSLPTGAQLRYVTKDAKLVKALHVWFEAQVNQHGDHAMTGK
jgi:hypothetical protein